MSSKNLKMKESRVAGDRAQPPPGDGEDGGLCFHPDGPETSQNNPIERTELRNRYRQLIKVVQESREDMLNPTNNKLAYVLGEAEQLFKNVRQVREAALDAQLLVMATDLAKEKAIQMCACNGFEPSVFAEHLLSFMGLNRLDDDDDGQQGAQVVHGYQPPDAWQRVSSRVECCFKTAPSFHSMIGLLSATPPPLKLKMKKSSCKEASRMMPTQLTKLDGSQETTEKEVERILGYLKGYYRDDPSSPMIYYKFVIDPDSFSRTVENIFHTSFLIRDELARVYLDDSKVPCIEPVEQKTMRDEGSSSSKQCIISLSPKLWKELIDALEIKTAMIQPKPQNP